MASELTHQFPPVEIKDFVFIYLIFYNFRAIDVRELRNVSHAFGSLISKQKGPNVFMYHIQHALEIYSVLQMKNPAST